MSTFIYPEQSLPQLPAYDVVVCGGGPAGCATALSARRAGRSVLLLEQTGQLGGVATTGGVCIYLGYRTSTAKWVGGIFEEIVQDLLGSGGAIDPLTLSFPTKYQPFGWFRGLDNGIPFEPPAGVMLFDRKMREAGVDVLFYTAFVDAIINNGRITHIILQNKSGLQAVPTLAVIDATGDADVAARSGCPLTTGREEDGLMTPASMIFCMDRVDRETLSEHINTNDEPRFRKLITSLRAQEKWPFSYDIFIAIQLLDDDVFMINTTRLCGVDGTDGASMSQGTMDGREEVRQLVDLMREFIPGFAQSRLRWISPGIGIRETRRIIGAFRLTVDDLQQAIDFPDNIGFSVYGWDLPDPKRPSYQPMHEAHPQMPRPQTAIPYRIMLPQGISNLICPGRAVSVERDVLGPLRVMAPCFAMGEAAGLAADEVITNSCSFAEVDIQRLRDRLRAQGAIVDAEQVVNA